jgi:hypothetical protein
MNFSLLNLNNIAVVVNESDYKIYTFNGDETCYIEIDSKNPTYVKVSLPLKTSTYQYRISFSSLECAEKYIENWISSDNTRLM